MSYMALYRKWRPDDFGEVKGQEHIVATLKNQINYDRIGHAYLFCGTRGTGKTTIAKLFAKAVNCEHPVDGSPCNECASCKAIANQSSMNVIEIDAASNNGVDNIREIRDEVQYSPAEGKYKVYIIDEVHMLSIGAFNALLKTLEEPPAYVIFILATTEPHKLPITILSRCQRYDFRRISIDTIADRLMDLMHRENVEVDEKAIRYISKVADGSMRDALSLLDQCIAFYLGKKLTYENVLEVLGAVDTKVFSDMLDSIVENDTVSALKQIDQLVWQGREFGQFVLDFTWYMRNILLVKSSDNATDMIDLSEENVNQLVEDSKKISLDTLMRYIRNFSEVANQIKYASQKRIILEIAIIKLCKPQMEENLDSVMDRLRILEAKVENIKFVAPVETSSESVSKQTDVQESHVEFNVDEELHKRLPDADVEELKQIIAKWNQVKKKLAGFQSRYINYARVNVGENGHSLILSFIDDDQGRMAKEYIEQQEHLDDLKNVLAEVTGKNVTVNCVMLQNKSNNSFDTFDLSKKINMEIEYEN